MADYDMLINCRQLNGSVPTTVSRQLKSIYEHTLAEAARQSGFSSEPARGVSVSTVGESGAHARSLVSARPNVERSQYAVVKSDKGCLVAAARSALFKLTEPDRLTLDQGSVLVHSKADFAVEAKGRQVLVSGGAVALVQVKDGALKAVDLGDFHRNSVRVVAGKRVINLAPGRELILSEGAPSLSDVFDVHKLGHRGIVSSNLPEVGWLTSSEVALNDYLSHHPLVAALRSDSSDAAARAAIGQVKKTAAVVVLLRRGGGAFQRGEPEDETGGTMRIAARCNSCLR
jgi:hypothetical protein